jgi:(p)ppGpp synthase/HD superfamily hydrolase
MTLLDKAIIIATNAHAGQVDKGGNPYILHPLSLMVHMKTENERIVAALHDVLEDTSVTIDFLRQEGFGDDIIIPLVHLTRQNTETYMDFIKRASLNPISKAVKIDDIKNNMDLSRIINLSQKDYDRFNKYKKALTFLEQ